MKNSVLIIGDSITEGISGISYIPYMEKKLPDHIFHNHGLGGDTLSGITQRLLILLETKQDYDYIVIEAGHNDIVIPYLQKQDVFLKLMARNLIKRGSTPIPEPDRFGEVLEERLRAIKLKKKADIVLTTLNCIGEDLNSELNMNRKLINNKIKEIGSKYNCHIADVGAVFDVCLENKSSSGYFLGSFFKLMLIDPFYSKKESWTDLISNRRGLYLTIDGLHINKNGALIYSDTINKCLLEI